MFESEIVVLHEQVSYAIKSIVYIKLLQVIMVHSKAFQRSASANRSELILHKLLVEAETKILNSQISVEI